MTKQEKCSQCGKTISENKSFCDECWAKILKSQNSETNPNSPSVNSITYLEQQKSKYGAFSYLFLMNKGRIPRSTYNIFSFFILLVFLILAAITYNFLYYSTYYSINYRFEQVLDIMETFAYISPIVLSLYYFQLMLTIKRLHDLNLSGGFVVIPFALSAIPIINILVCFGYNLYLIFAPGTDGENNFGPNPKAKVETQTPGLPS